MNKFTLTFISRALMVLALVVSPLYTAAPQTASPANQVTEFEVNGLKVLVKRRPGTPTVAADLFIRGGVRNMTPENAGIERFALTAATEGSKFYPRQKLRTETSRISTSIAAGSNYDLGVIAMACTKLNFDISWKMFVDVALNPTFAPADVDRIREALISSLRTQSDSPEASLESTSNDLIFAGHPYSVDPDGTIQNISKFKPADLIAYHRRIMQTSHLLLVVVGDVEPDAIQKQVAASFAGVPRGDYKDAPVPPLSFTAPSVDVTTRAVQTNYVKGVFAAPSIRDDDYYAMRTAVAILQSAVFEEVRVKRNLSYAPDATLDERSANTGSISVSAVNANEAVQVMLAEIQKLKQNALDDDTIGRMGGYFLTTYYLKEETNAAQASELAQYELIGGGWRHSLEFMDRIRKVKPADVQAVANKYMKNLRFVIVGQPKDIDRTIFLKN